MQGFTCVSYMYVLALLLRGQPLWNESIWFGRSPWPYLYQDQNAGLEVGGLQLFQELGFVRHVPQCPQIHQLLAEMQILGEAQAVQWH